MISVEFPEDGVLCGMGNGTALCACVKGTMHDWINPREPHICVCGGAWFTKRDSDIVVPPVVVEPDYNHPHDEVEIYTEGHDYNHLLDREDTNLDGDSTASIQEVRS